MMKPIPPGTYTATIKSVEHKKGHGGPYSRKPKILVKLAGVKKKKGK